jgi:hypothetical protein
MYLTELPLERFHEIIRQSIEVRGLQRGGRLRLVNSMYSPNISSRYPV